MVRVSDDGNEESLYHTCDFLINANGHYSLKNIPDLPGLKGYTGQQVHMHDLRHIGDIKAEKILVAGVSYGAYDLVAQLLFDFPQNFD